MIRVYCTSEFEKEYKQLVKKNSYASLTQGLIDHFFVEDPNSLLNGTNLNGNLEVPFIKCRIEGRGGFRVYFLLILKKESVYLSCVYPKTGSEGSENLTREGQKFVFKNLVECIESGSLLELEIVGDGLVFK